MKFYRLISATVFILFTFTGCASLIANKTIQAEAEPLLEASGQAALPTSSHLTPKQQQLSAEQAAKMQAYRRLAAQLYQHTLTARGHSAKVGERVVQHEDYRLYVDLYLREARVAETYVAGSRVFVKLQLPVGQRFDTCMQADLGVVAQCLRQDQKMSFTRLGYAGAETKIVNLSCLQPDCSDQLHTAGYGKTNHPLDKALLDAGLYDTEWMANMAGRLFINSLILEANP